MNKSKAFALRTIRVCSYLRSEKHEYEMSRQLLKSGTSIGANIREAMCAQSRADFFAKLHVSYKEANETAYWLELLHESGFIDDRAFESVYSDCRELILILAAITKHQKPDRPNSYC